MCPGWMISRSSLVVCYVLFLGIPLTSNLAYANVCTLKRPKVSAVCGRVDGLATGPIAGVTVVLFDPESMTRLQSAKTDADGRFEFHAVKKGHYHLEVDREFPQWVSWPIQVTATGAGQCRELLVVKVDPVLKMGSCLDHNRVEKQKFVP